MYDTVQPEQSRNMDLLLIQAWLATTDPDRCPRRGRCAVQRIILNPITCLF